MPRPPRPARPSVASDVGLALLVLVLGLSVSATAQTPATLPSPNPESSGRFGIAVAGVPDANGDGDGDLLIGAHAESSGGLAGAGRAYLVSGATGAVLLTLASPNGQADGGFGFSVAGVPDADGDGRGDLLIGAPMEAVSGSLERGRAYLYSGATGALLQTLTSSFQLEFTLQFGYAVAGVPDTDGDGRGDLLIGAGLQETQAFLHSGGSGALIRTLSTPNYEGDSGFGKAVAGVGDVNGDGRGDLLIGAGGENGGGATNSGRAYLYDGAAGTVLRTLESPNGEASGRFGDAVAGVPDVDGDGFGELLIGAPGEDVGSVLDGGRAYLVSGASGAAMHALSAPQPQTAGRFGAAVAGVADADGDGRGDLLIGADDEDGGGATDAGRAYLVSGTTAQILRRLASPNAEADGAFGSAVAGVPDLNGDGLGDIAIGAPAEDASATDDGRAYLYASSTASASLAGPEGWRLLASPVLSSVQSLLSGLFTQGAAGATTSDGGPNVFGYDETIARDRDLGFTALTDLDVGTGAGRGYAVYAFEDDDPTTGGVQGGFPKALSVTGLGATGSDVEFPITFTSTAELQEDGWNLIGNPYDASLDWDVAGWTKSGLDNTIYVYDPAAGTYTTWNGTAGSLGDGLVDDFQGFWVKAHASNPQLVAPAGARTTATPPVAASTALGLAVEGTVAGQAVRDELFVAFHGDALVGLDPLDAYELVPFRSHYAALYALADGVALDISALPAGEASVEIPLDVAAVADGAFTGGAMTLTWPDLSDLPASWRLTLADTRENTTVDLRAESGYAFSIASSNRAAREVLEGKAAQETPPVPTPLFDAAEGAHHRSAGARFMLRIDAGASVDAEDDTPGGFGIASVRPNPLGGRGVVVARLSEGGRARLALYDALGREAALLLDRTLPAGRHEVTLDPAALGLAAGVYVVRLQAGDRTASQTITVLR